MNLNHPPQLELKLAATTPARHRGRQARFNNRAAWWFDRMRRIADSAMDWPPATPCRANAESAKA